MKVHIIERHKKVTDKHHVMFRKGNLHIPGRMSGKLVRKEKLEHNAVKIPAAIFGDFYSFLRQTWELCFYLLNTGTAAHQSNVLPPQCR